MSIYDISGKRIADDAPNANMSMFHRFGVCGASWDNGFYYKNATTAAVREDLSWGANIARRNGNVFCCYAHSGVGTRTWLTNNACLARMLADDPCDLYIITLGGNDIGLGMNYLGSLDDITDYESYTDYPDTFYGNYGKIIEQIQGHAPKAKLIMAFAWSANSTATRLAFAEAVQEIAEHYEIPVINWRDDPWRSSTFFSQMLVNDHPTPASLTGYAMCFERLFSKCVADNHEYFLYYDGSSF